MLLDWGDSDCVGKVMFIILPAGGELQLPVMSTKSVSNVLGLLCLDFDSFSHV